MIDIWLGLNAACERFAAPAINGHDLLSSAPRMFERRDRILQCSRPRVIF